MRISSSMYRHIYLVFLVLSVFNLAAAQVKKGPVAKFTFNNKAGYDEVSGIKAKLRGVTYTNDRFGNKNNAVYLYGNANSYINLGSHKALKPRQGSISIWVRLEGEIWSGKGREMNSIIITKNAEGDDFYEAYDIIYFLDTKKISAVCSKDSTNQITIHSIERFRLFKWHHLVMTYDDNSLAFYIDGALEKRLVKNFETKFLATDSVMVGVTANKKNNRFSDGTFDDIEFYDRVLTDEEVYELYNAPNPYKNRIILNWVLAGLGVALLIVLIIIYIRYRIRIALKREKERMSLANTALENELRVHRALMNPHFIFNSLNGLQNFILTNATEAANDYLVKFSKLIRKILESNMSDTITLELEIELLERYLEIEDMRFEENIAHNITVDPSIVISTTVIPIMMLQPFVENAIWHGLLNKDGDKAISISFNLYEKKYIQCIIEDNGIGRKLPGNDDLEKKSLATLFIRQRLELLNKIHNLHCSLAIEDKPGRQGTIVRIILPVLNA